MIILSTTLTAKPYKAGQLRILGVGSPHRLPAFPELPTIAESGLPGYEATTWFGLFATAGTPQPIVTKINAEVVKTLADPQFREKFLAPQMFEPMASSPEEFADYIKAQTRKWAKVIHEQKLSIEK